MVELELVPDLTAPFSALYSSDACCVDGILSKLRFNLISLEFKMLKFSSTRIIVELWGISWLAISPFSMI
jgi:hypothetical protein